MKTLLVFLLFCHTSSAVEHTMRFFLTGSSGVSAFPEFMGLIDVNNIQEGYCDSNTFETKNDWGENVRDIDPEQVLWYHRECYEDKPFFFKELISSLKQRLNQTEGIHILQFMSGCKLDESTGQVLGFLQYGYDGEDFITLDLNTLTWIAPSPKAVITKLSWDTDTERLKFNERFLTEICPRWLKTVLHYGEKMVLRTDPPSVSLLQKTPSSAVSCHATGFYPDRALMFWSKDGEEIHEGVEHGEILPNHDGTFQMTVDLNVSSAEDWRRYDCVFQFEGAEDRIITQLDEAEIRTNRVKPHTLTVLTITAVCLVLVAMATSGYMIYQRRKNNLPPSSPENITELTENLNPPT